MNSTSRLLRFPPNYCLFILQTGRVSRVQTPPLNTEHLLAASAPIQRAPLPIQSKVNRIWKRACIPLAASLIRTIPLPSFSPEQLDSTNISSDRPNYPAAPNPTPTSAFSTLLAICKDGQRVCTLHGTTRTCMLPQKSGPAYEYQLTESTASTTSMPAGPGLSGSASSTPSTTLRRSTAVPPSSVRLAPRPTPRRR
jgi:hypothetical protein